MATPKQIKSIPLRGITRNTPDEVSEDGGLLEAINLRSKDGAWRGVHDKEATGYQTQQADVYGVPYHHPVLPANTYVLHNVTDNTIDTILFDETTDNTPVVQLTLCVGEVFDRFSCMGNVLMVWCVSTKYTLYYDSTTGTYKDLSFLPIPLVGVSEIDTETKDITDKVITYLDPTPDYGLGDYNLTEYVRTNLIGEYYKSNAEMREKNKIEGFVVVRLAYRLFDGSYIMHSLPYAYHIGYCSLHKPVLSYTISPEVGSDPWSLKWNYYAKMAVLYNFFGTGSFTLPDFNLCGIIESLDVFCTRPISSYNYALTIDKWVQDGSTFTPSYQTDSITKIMEEPLYKVHSIPIADIVKEVDHHDGVTGKYLYAKAGVVYPDMTKEISANELMPVDSFSHHSKVSACDYQYNSRMHIGDVAQKLSAGFNNLFHAMFVRKYGVHNGYDQLADMLITSDAKTKFLGDYQESGGLAPTGFKLYQQVYLKSDEGTKVITSEIQKSFVTTFDSANIPTGYAYYYYYDTAVTKKALVLNPIISYPDYRAIKIRYFYTQGTDRFWLADFALKSLPGMNIAYYMPDLNSTDGSTGAYSPNIVPLPNTLSSGTPMPSDDVLTDSDTITDTNRVQVSEQSNPFYWPAQNSYRFGLNENCIIAIAGVQTAMSDSAFGQYPLYVFSKSGVYALQTGNGEVLYSSIQHINNEVLLKRYSLAEISGAIVFACKEGIRIVQGANVSELSIPVEGSVTNPLLSSPAFLSAISGYNLPDIINYLSNITFSAYITDCIILFDVENKEIIISSLASGTVYSYVYSFYTKVWTTRTEVFKGGMIVDGRMIGIKQVDVTVGEPDPPTSVISYTGEFVTSQELPTTGSITVSKVITDNPEDETYFHIKLTGQGEDASAVDGYVNQTGAITFNDLPFDEYILTEYAQDGYSLVSVSGSVMLDADHLTGSIEVVNEIQSLELVYGNISVVPVENVNSISDWDTLFETMLGTSVDLTSVSVLGNTVKLYSSFGFSLPSGLYDFSNADSLVSISDKAGYISGVETMAFDSCISLVSISLPEASLTISTQSFSGCSSLQTALFPKATQILGGVFYNCDNIEEVDLSSIETFGDMSHGDGRVFQNVSGATLTLKIPSHFMTDNAGSPHEEVQYLIGNNTVTIFDPLGNQIYPT